MRASLINSLTKYCPRSLGSMGSLY